MTAVLPRLERAFDEPDRRAIDRRTLLRAGAWAAPVIVLATAAPAAAASADPASTPAPRFSDYFVWDAQAPADNWGSIQIADSTLVNKTGRTLTGVTAMLSVSPAPGAKSSWVPNWNQPRAATSGGWTTAPFTMPAVVNTPQRLQFSATNSARAKIAPGTYTMTVTLAWTENGKTITVSEGRSVTISG